MRDIPKPIKQTFGWWCLWALLTPFRAVMFLIILTFAGIFCTLSPNWFDWWIEHVCPPIQSNEIDISKYTIT